MKDYNIYNERYFTTEEIKRLIPRLADAANKRLRSLEKSNMHVNRRNEYKNAYAVAKDYLGDRKSFSRSIQRNNQSLRREFHAIVDFMTSKSSTITGNKLIDAERRSRIENEISRRNKTDFKFTNEEWEEFQQFLESSEYKSLKKTVDSKQIMEDFALAMSDDSEDYDDIMREYREYLNTNMTFEQVNEKRRSKKLLK